MKAIALLSGGLDSTLAVKLIKDQGIDVIAINFTSPFCTCTSKNSGCSSAVKSAKELGVPLKVISKGLDYFKIVENPKFGYGSNMNPCIDCRIYIFKKAKKIMEEEGASFLISGEVVGQRPMSQKKHTLRLIEKEAGVEDILLRPLSAKLLPPTLPERMGWVDREKLLAISGRGRSEQIKIAKNGNIDYPCPAGGCLLTDKFIANRVRDLFRYKKNYDLEDIKLLKIGRHIRVSENIKVIVARDEGECIKLQNSFNPSKDLIIYCVEPKGPTLLINDFSLDNVPKVIFQIAYRYSDAKGMPLLLDLDGVVKKQVTFFETIDDNTLKSMII
jgi:tRNA U34 2-thiouridine synthase MnmA/TrmU